jgi:LPXTG-site transpeptidase (sortase) family protein
LFAKLNKISIGDEAMVVNSNGEIFSYKLVHITDVWPDDISFLNSSVKPTLTLQTCSGFWSQYRRLYFFDFEGIK